MIMYSICSFCKYVYAYHTMDTHTHLCSVCCPKPATCVPVASPVVMQTSSLSPYLPLGNTGMNVKTKQSPSRPVCRPHSISQYLCKQRTRLNFSLESPRMREDVTGGYFPFYASCGPIDVRLRYFSPDVSEGVSRTGGMLRIRFRI